MIGRDRDRKGGFWIDLQNENLYRIDTCGLVCITCYGDRVGITLGPFSVTRWNVEG